MHCWRAEARSEPTGICLRCWSYNAKGIGRTVSCEAVLAYFSRVCSAFPTTSREACLSLLVILRCKTPPSTSSPPWWRCASSSSAVSDARRCLVPALSIASCRLWASVSRRRASYIATCSAESARAELVLFEISLLYMYSRLSAILVRFVYLDTRKTDNGRSEVLVM